jgi:Yip1 domain
MKEILERILKQLPSFLPDLGRLLTGPKRAIVGWVDEAKGDLSRPLVFVGVAIGIGFVLQLPLLGKEHEFMATAASMGLFKLVALLAFATIIHLLFRIVGGRAAFTSTFAAYLYLASPLYMALVLLDLGSQGVVRAFDPTLVAAARVDPLYFVSHPERAREFAAAAPQLALAYSLLMYAKLFIVLGWFTACWGAFRQLHGVKRWRSSVAGLAAALAFVVYTQALEFVLLGMFGVRAPPLM